MKALADARPFELECCLAGLPALQSSEPGQVRKEAATTIEASAGGLARLLTNRKTCQKRSRRSSIGIASTASNGRYL